MTIATENKTFANSNSNIPSIDCDVFETDAFFSSLGRVFLLLLRSLSLTLLQNLAFYIK